METKKQKTSYFDRLNKLFTRSIRVHIKGKDEIHNLDINKLQQYSNLETNRSVTSKYSSMRRSYGDYHQSYSLGANIQRTDIYIDYEAMDRDSLLSTALDIYAEEATTENQLGEVLSISSDNEQIKDSLENLFYDILNVNFNLFCWIRNTVKYGDFFLKLDITEKVGITRVTPLSGYAVKRQEDPHDENNVIFTYDNQLGVDMGIGIHNTDLNNTEFKNYEIGHFRLLSDSNFLPYGRSILELARRDWKRLQLLEDAMMLNRIMRAPERRIFKIDVGSIPPNEIDAYMEQVTQKLQKTPYIDQNTGEINMNFNLMNMLEDFYIPVRGDNSSSEIDTLGGIEWTGIDDIEYIKNKILAAIKIPKGFLGFDEVLDGRETLSGKDVRFSRTIARVQKMIESELTKIALIHLYSQGFSDEDLTNFEVKLTLPSTAAQIEKLEMLDQQINVANNLKDLNMHSEDWIYENIFNETDQDIELMNRQLINDKKKQFRLTSIEEEGNDPYAKQDKEKQEEDDLLDSMFDDEYSKLISDMLIK